MTQDKKAPKLRFKGFTDDWEHQSFLEFANRRTKNIENKQLPNITFDDIESGSGKLKISYSKLNHGKKGIFFKTNDILFGKLRPYLKNILFASFDGIAVGDFWVLHSIDGNPYFLYSLIQTPKFMYVSNISSGSKMPRSDWSLVSKYKYNIPKKEEQEKMGRLISKLDQNLLTQQRKLDQLKLLKKGLLQKMFADKKSKVPEIRFKEFDGEWEKNKLSNILNYEQPSKYIVSSNKYDNSYLTPVLTAGKTFIIGYTNETNGIYSASFKNPVIIFDDFMTSSQYVEFPFKVKSSAIKILTSNENSNILFSYELLNNIKYIPEDHRRHWISMFANKKVRVPSLKEQNKIGQLLHFLNKTTQKQQHKLNQLQQIKKFLLQNMFI